MLRLNVGRATRTLGGKEAEGDGAEAQGAGDKLKGKVGRGARAAVLEFAVDDVEIGAIKLNSADGAAVDLNTAAVEQLIVEAEVLAQGVVARAWDTLEGNCKGLEGVVSSHHRGSRHRGSHHHGCSHHCDRRGGEERVEGMR